MDVPEELAGAGFTPAFRPQQTGKVELGADPVSIFGIGANMALRRSTFESVGGFDELLGAGAPVFKAGEDTDYALRVLRRGIKVATSAHVPVLHYGARADDDLLALRRNYVLGMAGYLQKHVRLADRVSREYLRRRVEALAGEMFRELLTCGRPRGARDLAWLLEGIVASVRLYKVDPQRELYVA